MPERLSNFSLQFQPQCVILEIVWVITNVLAAGGQASLSMRWHLSRLPVPVSRFQRVSGNRFSWRITRSTLWGGEPSKNWLMLANLKVLSNSFSIIVVNSQKFPLLWNTRSSTILIGESYTQPPASSHCNYHGILLASILLLTSVHIFGITLHKGASAPFYGVGSSRSVPPGGPASQGLASRFHSFLDHPHIIL